VSGGQDYASLTRITPEIAVKVEKIIDKVAEGGYSPVGSQGSQANSTGAADPLYCLKQRRK
jgi:hypothetical protein